MYFYRLAVNKSCSIFKMLATSGCLTGVYSAPNSFRSGLCPDPTGGAYSAPHTLQLV